MLIEVWSDVVCPWCYVGKRNLESALAGFEHAGDVQVVWRSFELDPQAERERSTSYLEALATKYAGGTGPDELAQGQAMLDRMTATGRDAGLDLRFDLARGGNSFDAHRLLHHARTRDLQGALKERLMAATFTQGEAVGDRQTLVRLAAEVGLDGDECAAVLGGDAYAADVREEEATAHDLGATGVPFFVLDRRSAVPGAQPPEVLLQVLQQTWDAAHTAAPGG